jgi:tetratricopeptide (TPR) repeat protein
MRRVFPLLAALLLLAPDARATSPRGGLPRLAPTALPAPEPPVVAELDQAIKLLVSPRPGDHEAGMLRLKEGGEKWLPAISRRLAELKKTINKEQAAIYITEARKGGRKKGPPPSGDPGWLPLVLAAPRSDAPYRDLVTVLSLERALVQIGTTPAVRELIGVYLQYGDLLRIDVQHMIALLGDRAVPALLEARKHDAEKMRQWASRQLDAIGKAVPSETVQIQDQDVLADVLRAYGRTRDIDALRVVVSFTSSDRSQVRDAAREALVNYGDAALWQLREAYENLTGKRPPPGSTWDKLALELFESHDRARLEEIFQTFEAGLASFKNGKLDEMAAQFDAVLARAPTFERRAEMVEGYLALARKVEPSDRPRAALLARKALRLDPQSPRAQATEAYILTLEAEQLASEGLVDTAPLKRAIELDPSSSRPRDLLARLEASPQARAHEGYRYLAAAAIGALAVLASLLVGLSRRPPSPS